MKIRLVAGSLLSLALASTCACAQGTLLVANQKDRTLSVIDAASAHQTAAIAEERITGHEVAASPDGRTAYLPIYGNAGVGRPGTDGHEMLVIDIASRKIINTVDFGHGVRPHLPVYDTHRNVLYVSTELDQSITAIDPKTLKILYTIPTGAPESHMFALSHSGKYAYTTNVGAASVSVLDLDAHKTLAVIPIGSPDSLKVQRISISNDDKLLFTSDWKTPRLAVIDTSTRKLKTWVPLPATGYGSAPTHDGRYLLLTLPNAAKLAVIDLATLTIVRTIDVPSAPQEVLIRPDGKVAYVSCNVSHQVAAVDLTTWKVQSIIDAGNGADGLAWASTPASAAAGGIH
ncbi:cytochrome D1 domain-containing protein [Granulicella sp. dw_53]|uniref:YncE family protein n=1 Tax=Granulicella sp. dw_53 TaxID=2719792 RepID=UPI001BD2D8BA|nr:cytochrome D1 domain-containing protein [Granulicella sp. dw_53]